MALPATVHLLDYPGAQKSALWGMKDLFDHADARARDLGAALFDTQIVDHPTDRADVVILPPALSLDPPKLPADWRTQLIALHASQAVLVSICSGAFLLAETGLCTGRRITTHWRHRARFSTMYPDVIVATDQLLVDLDDIITAGGVMAWTDLSLHVIQRFGGRQLMLEVARMFVLDPPDRAQSYYAQLVPDTRHSDPQIARIEATLKRDPSARHSLAALARSHGLSERSLLRRFKAATGKSPLAYLQAVRIDAARSRLELTQDSFERISWDMGYSDPAAFRRVFHREIGLTPSDYRRRFGPKTSTNRT